MVHALFRWEPIGEYLDGNDFIADQLDVELLQIESDDREMQHGISQLEGELLQIFQQDHHQLEQYVDWLLDQMGQDTPMNDDLDEEVATAALEL